MNHEFDLRSITGCCSLFENWTSEGDKIIAAGFDLQASGIGSVEIESSQIEVSCAPLDGFGGVGYGGIVIRENIALYKSTSFYGSVKNLYIFNESFN